MENFYDNNTGEISLAGGVPNPGIQTNLNQPSLVMATIVFRVKKEGEAKIAFSDDSAIYSNADNLNILTIKRDLDITFKPTPTSVPNERLECGGKEGKRCPEGYICQSLTEGFDVPGECIPVLQPSEKPLPSTTPVLKSDGDGNKDGKIDLKDMSLLLSKFNTKVSGGVDLNGDELINSFDFSLMINLLIQNKVIRGT